jgi:tetratricopeptide (TPR) repeat protein
MNNPLMKNIKIPLLAFLLIIIGLGIASAFKSRTPATLGNEAMGHAQVARNISEGRSFTTSVIPVPSGTVVKAPEASDFVYELQRAPLYPVLLAGAFGARGASDKTVTEFSTVLYLLGSVLLFALGQRVLKQVALSFGVALAYLLSVPVLSAATTGHFQLLSAVLLLALLLSLTPKNEAVEEVEDTPATRPSTSRVNPRSFVLVGLLAGLCYLADYCSLFYVVPLLVLWPRTARKWNGMAVLFFLVGFILICAPWWIRNIRLTGDPLYGAEWLILIGKGEGARSVLSYWRAGLGGFFTNAVTVPHLLLSPFILLSFWVRPDRQPLARRTMAVLSAALFAIVGLAAFGRTSSADMVPLAGLLALVGMVTFHKIVSDAWFANSISRKIAAPLRFEPVPGDPGTLRPMVTRADRFWRFHEVKLWFLSLLRMPVTLRKVGEDDLLYAGKWPLKRVYEARAISILLLLFLAPLGLQIASTSVTEPVDVAAAMKPLAGMVNPDRVIVTDAPQAITWYSGRKTMPLPERVSKLMDITRPKIGALYLTDRAVGQTSAEWRPAYQGAQIPGYQNVNLKNTRELLYLKQPSTEELLTMVKAAPKKADNYFAMGRTLLQEREFEKALQAFAQAERLNPKQADAYFGSGEANLNIRNIAAAKKQVARGLQLAPRSTAGLLMMAMIVQSENNNQEAIRYYEKVLADVPNEPRALNNLAALYEMGNGNLFRALEMSRRAAAQNPNNGSILDTLGWTCFRLGYRDEALQYLKQAAKLSPENQTIQNHLKQAQAGAKPSA